jgi:hypothetical protein
MFMRVSRVPGESSGRKSTYKSKEIGQNSHTLTFRLRAFDLSGLPFAMPHFGLPNTLELGCGVVS